MEKEKRKGRPRRRWNIAGVLTVILLLIGCSFWAWSYYISPGHSLSEFSRFESEEEVVAFLHEHFDVNVTTSHDIRTFMSAYPLEYDDGCLGDFAGHVLNEEVTNIILCYVPYWGSVAGTEAYLLSFYINTDDKLVYIKVNWVCWCL